MSFLIFWWISSFSFVLACCHAKKETSKMNEFWNSKIIWVISCYFEGWNRIDSKTCRTRKIFSLCVRNLLTGLQEEVQPHLRTNSMDRNGDSFLILIIQTSRIWVHLFDMFMEGRYRVFNYSNCDPC